VSESMLLRDEKLRMLSMGRIAVRGMASEKQSKYGFPSRGRRPRLFA
jgi:hypothetical protein